MVTRPDPLRSPATRDRAVGWEIEIIAADHALYDDAANRMTSFVLGK